MADDILTGSGAENIERGEPLKEHDVLCLVEDEIVYMGMTRVGWHTVIEEVERANEHALPVRMIRAVLAQAEE